MRKISTFILALGLVFVFASCGNKEAQKVENPDSLAAKAPVVEQPAASNPGAGQIQTLKGTFTNIEMGDYAHFNMVDEQGVDRSFFVAPDMPEAEYALFEGGKNDGKKVEITWRTIERDIPEAGGKMGVEEVVSAKLAE
jgi:hypothetical protein